MSGLRSSSRASLGAKRKFISDGQRAEQAEADRPLARWSARPRPRPSRTPGRAGRPSVPTSIATRARPLRRWPGNRRPTSSGEVDVEQVALEVGLPVLRAGLPQGQRPLDPRRRAEPVGGVEEDVEHPGRAAAAPPSSSWPGSSAPARPCGRGPGRARSACSTPPRRPGS